MGDRSTLHSNPPSGHLRSAAGSGCRGCSLEGCASGWCARCYRRIRQLTTPVDNSLADAPEVVTVHDPTHPLYGRRLLVASRPHAPGRARHAPPGIFTGYSPIASALACHPPSVDSADGDQTHSGCRGGPDRDGPRVWHMAIRPATLWGLLPHDVQQAIVADLQTMVSEVIHVYDPGCPTPSSPTRHARACPAAGLAR